MYREVRIPVIDEKLDCRPERVNIHDEATVKVICGGTIVGH